MKTMPSGSDDYKATAEIGSMGKWNKLQKKLLMTWSLATSVKWYSDALNCCFDFFFLNDSYTLKQRRKEKQGRMYNTSSPPDPSVMGASSVEETES